MTMPHKICPQCGQPAVLAMMQCQRCGFVYGLPTPAAAPPFPSPHSREMPRGQPPARQARRTGPRTALVVLVLGAVVLGAMVRVWRRSVLHQATSAARGLSGVNPAPADPASPPGSLSMFTESESPQEQPVLTFRNFAIGVMTLTLRDRYGHVYRASSEEGQKATLQVPAGDYSVSIDSSDPRIRPNWGDAAFHRFKAYHADFVLRHTDRRIHLGD